MFGLASSLRTAKRILIVTLLLLPAVFSTLEPLKAATPNVPPGKLNVSPGKSDQNLGAGFPDFVGPVGGSSVKLTYPNSSILTNSTGDLLFTVTLSPGVNTFQGVPCAYLSIPASQCPNVAFYNSVDIYIPPDFSGLLIQNVWTSFTNNYDSSLSLSLTHQSSADQIGPNWWRLSVRNITVTGDLTYPNRNFNLTRNRIFIANQAQYIKLFQVTSPTTAGRYFFKAFANNSISFGNANFPTLVVKGSRDPAYISGTLRYSGATDPKHAGQPIDLPTGYGAQILATGIDYLGHQASAQAFINSTAQGRYTIFGVAPGAYNITAYAAGFQPVTRPTLVNVVAAQSLIDVDIYMIRSVNVTGTVLSETGDGQLIPWFGNYSRSIWPFGANSSRSISVQVLNLTGSVVASTPAPYAVTLSVNPFSTSFNFSIRRQVGYDGRIPQDYANYTSGMVSGDYLLRAYVTSYIQLEDVYIHVTNQTLYTTSVIPLIRTGVFLVTVHFMNSNGTIRPDQILYNPTLNNILRGINGTPVGGTLTLNAYDQQGVLRAQNITSVPANSTRTTAELVGFSQANQRGTRSLFQQDYGIMPGTYHIVASFTSSSSFAGFANVGIRNLYYQTTDLQATIGLGLGYLNVSIPMYQGGGIEFTLRSIDGQTPSISRPWAYPGAPVTFQIIDKTGVLYQGNASQPEACPSGQYWNETAPSSSLFNCVSVLPFNCTFPTYSIFPGFSAFGDSDTLTISYFGLLPNGNDYTIIIQTVGYAQRQVVKVHVTLCACSDLSIWMVQDPVIPLTLTFKLEGLLTTINSTQAYARPLNHLDATPIRLELFDDRGNFIAANNTYIPNLTFNPYLTKSTTPFPQWCLPSGACYTPTTTTNTTITGFKRYFGDPKFTWSGFYDATDAVQQNDGGILPGTYVLRIWVDGYYQSTPIRITLPAQTFGRKQVSIVNSIYRASRIHGDVRGPDIFDQARPLSWATVDFKPLTSTPMNVGNFTTSSLDGSFELWTPPSSYYAGVSLNGYTSYAMRIEVSSGADIYLYIWMESG